MGRSTHTRCAMCYIRALSQIGRIISPKIEHCRPCLHQSNNTSGGEASAWPQVTFTARCGIGTSGWLANVDVSKPPAPQMDAARELQAAITAEQLKAKQAEEKLAARRLAHDSHNRWVQSEDRWFGFLESRDEMNE